VLLGQHMYDNYAEALDEAVVCVMNRSNVQQYLLSDPRIATRITEILGRRLVEMERRLCDSVFKSVPQRVAGTLATLAGQQRRLGVGPRTAQVALTHEQLAALVGTSRETATKVLGELADRGLIRLARGKITILDPARVSAEAGD
jgi:CRP/FNR family cyclic AMP-dependent transcriptional regulator